MWACSLKKTEILVNKKSKKAITGRQKEQILLHELLTSNRAEFIAIYGRRRVGNSV